MNLMLMRCLVRARQDDGLFRHMVGRPRNRRGIAGRLHAAKAGIRGLKRPSQANHDCQKKDKRRFHQRIAPGHPDLSSHDRVCPPSPQRTLTIS